MSPQYNKQLYNAPHRASEELELGYVYNPLSKGGIVISSVRLRTCLSVCLSVNTITPEPLELSSRYFPRIIQREAKFENGYIGVRGW